MGDAPQFTLASLWTDALPVVRWVAVVWTVVLMLWSVLVPTFSAPDEPQHVNLIVDATRFSPFEWVAPRDADMSTVIQEAQEQYGYFGPPGDLGSGERRLGGRAEGNALPRDARPGYSELLLGDGVPGTRVNQMAQHPPLYYRTASWVLQVIPDWRGLPFDRVIGLLRLLSVLAMAPLPLILAGIAARLNGRESLTVAAAVSVFLVPQLAHLGSVVSNDPLLVVLSALLTLLLARVITGDLSNRTARWVGGVLLTALLTKAFALFLIPAIAAAYVGAARAERDKWRLALRQLLRAGALGAFALLWYGENLIRFGGVQPSVSPPPLAAEQGALSDWVQRALMVQTQTFWGRFGWAETGFGGGTALALSGLLLVVVAVGAYRRNGLLLAMMLLPGTMISLITLAQSTRYFDLEGTIRAVQGRYFFVSLAGLLVLGVAGLQRALPDGLAPWTWAPVVVAGALLHAQSWVTSLRYFWTVPDDRALGTALRSMLAWQAWPPRLVQGVALLAVIVGAVLLRGLVHHARTLVVVDDDVPGGDRALAAALDPST